MRLNSLYENVNNLNAIIRQYFPIWDGMLYRVGETKGSKGYFHTSYEGAEFYQNAYPNDEVEAYYPPPGINNVLVLDLEDEKKFLEIMTKVSGLTPDEIWANDFALEIEDALPKFKSMGYDAVVIHGETGREVTGYPLEVVIL